MPLPNEGPKENSTYSVYVCIMCVNARECVRVRVSVGAECAPAPLFVSVSARET